MRGADQCEALSFSCRQHRDRFVEELGIEVQTRHQPAVPGLRICGPWEVLRAGYRSTSPVRQTDSARNGATPGQAFPIARHR